MATEDQEIIMTSAVQTSKRAGVGGALASGAVAGVLASIAMGIFAMVAGLVNGTGFFTPLHHIASLWAAPDAMMTSMEAAMGGNDFRITAGTAVLGAVIHMMTGAMYGAVFGLVLSRLHLRFGVLLAAGLAYGALVFVMSAFVGLPLAAAIFDAGDPISNMAEMAGWTTFAVEHLIFGLVLAALLSLAHRNADAPTQKVAAR
ncbi:hypothetical protein [Nocardioides sp. AX2bis]|uniref:hypothetical protein n=1 Tax=Nocardioides sp. AX2bis TaxID=2653157 RepID=UPI001F46822C|nr:hypothetical protein [Nocardioides sp. AX2bis]